MLNSYRKVRLGSAYRLKVLEEIKGRIITVLTTTTLCIRHEELQKEVGHLIHVQPGVRAVWCATVEYSSSEFCVALCDSRQQWLEPVISLALKSLDLNLHTSDFNREIAALYDSSACVVRPFLVQPFSLVFHCFPPLPLSPLSLSSLETRAYVAIFIYLCSMLTFAFF